MESALVEGERLVVTERVIVAPSVGVFRPASTEEGMDAGTDTTHADFGIDIAEGQVIGMVEGPGASKPVRSPFRGRLMGMMAHPGERVREGQPIAWLRTA